MEYAKKFIFERLKGIDYDKKPDQWSWLNALMMAVSDHALVNRHQMALIESVCGEVSCRRRGDSNKIPDDVFVIATWINTASLLSVL